MPRFQNNNHINHKAFAEKLGLTPAEFAELRRTGDVPKPDVHLLGEAPGWKLGTASAYKRQRDRLKAVTLLPVAILPPKS